MGAANTVNVDGLSAVATETSLAGGSGEFPLFTDGAAPYTGAITGTGSQLTGLAARIAVNPLVAADPSNLIIYQPGTPAGDKHAAGFHLSIAHRSGAGLLADDRNWHGHCAIHRINPDLSAAIHQPAGRGRKLCGQSKARPGSRSEFAAAALQRCLGRQCRRRDGEPADVAEFLCRQRARGLGGKGHVRRADADVRTE